MYEEINAQLEEAMQKVCRRRKLSSMLEELLEQQKMLKLKLEEHQAILKKENADVEQLEKKSLSHLFYTMLGKLGERVEEERKEALAAALKYDQAAAELTQVEDRIKEMRGELLQYRSCQNDYDNLYEKKREMILESHSEVGQKLLDLSSQLLGLKNNRKELEEAIAAGNEVMEHTNRALKSLDSAEGWGTYDLLGGGLLSDLAKHSHIDDAKAEAELIQTKLSGFRTELADVSIENGITFSMDEFGKFADFFFDGLIADWCMQSRIKESLDSVRNVRDQVQKVLDKLNRMKEDNLEKERNLEQETRGLIRNT
jgi:hypothetical protein